MQIYSPARADAFVAWKLSWAGALNYQHLIPELWQSAVSLIFWWATVGIIPLWFFSLFYSWNSYCNLNAVGLGLKEMLAGSVLCTIFLWQQKEGEWIVWSLSSIVVQMKPELETTFEIEALSPVHNFVSLILWVPRHINYSCKEEILRNFSWGNTALPRKKLFASKDT